MIVKNQADVIQEEISFLRSGCIPSGKQSLENHIARFTKAQTSVAFSGRSILSLHVEADAAAIDIRFTEFFNVHKESSEHALAAKIGMHVDTLNPPDLAVPPIAPLKRMSRLPHDSSVDHSHKVPSSLGLGNKASDSVSDRSGIKFPSFGFPTQRKVEMGNGFYVCGYGLSDLNHGSLLTS